ncbi:MAG: hypothetical protein ILP14_14180 [Oscillospiraceae bacterium]|nr:hypothetical protein [Oscillospiraceae bacterium]
MANKTIQLKDGTDVLFPVFPSIGERKYNLWNNSDSVLLLAEKFNGATFRINASSSSYPTALPTELQATTAILFRQQFMQYETSLTHGMVVLYEVYPISRRIWINSYNTSWSGWKAITEQCQNFANVKLDSIKQTMTPSVGSTYSTYGGLYYYKVGTKVHVNVGLQGLPNTSYTANNVGTLPAGYRPSHQVSAVCAGGTGSSYAQVIVTTQGTIAVYTNQQYVNGQIEFDVF